MSSAVVSSVVADVVVAPVKKTNKKTNKKISNESAPAQVVTVAPVETPVEASVETPIEASVEASGETSGETSVETKVKKTRAPTLLAKFAKFIQFQYFVVNQLDVDDDVKADLLLKLSVFADVPIQTALVEKFFVEQKTIAKEFKTAVSDKKKAAIKANKPKRASKKAVQLDFQNNLVNQLLESAATPIQSSEELKKTKKPRAKKSANTCDHIPNHIPNPIENPIPILEAKPKKSRAKKSSTTSTSTPANVNNHNDYHNDNDDLEVSVHKFDLDGKTFLKDADDNLYDILSQEIVGKLVDNLFVTL